MSVNSIFYQGNQFQKNYWDYPILSAKNAINISGGTNTLFSYLIKGGDWSVASNFRENSTNNNSQTLSIFDRYKRQDGEDWVVIKKHILSTGKYDLLFCKETNLIFEDGLDIDGSDNSQSKLSDTDNDQLVLVKDGKTYYAQPKFFTIPSGSHASGEGIAFEAYVVNTANVQCVGVNDRYYYFTGNINVEVDGSNGTLECTVYEPGRIEKSQVKNVIWGGKTTSTIKAVVA